MQKEGRNFDCSKCIPAIKKKRRCESDREDYTSKDDPIFPIFINKGSTPYGFCPGKATWDESHMELYNLLIVSVEMKNLLYTGGLDDQPRWYIDLLAEFVLRYDILKFSQKVEMVLGSDDKIKSSKAKFTKR